MDRLRAAGKDARALANLRLCAIGPRTAQELGTYGLTPDVVPTEFQAEGVIAALAHVGIRGSRILIPRAEVAREILPDQLRELGATVEVIPVYRTIVSSGGRCIFDATASRWPGGGGDIYEFLHRPQFHGTFRRAGQSEASSRRDGGGLHRAHYGTYGGRVWSDGHGHAG